MYEGGGGQTAPNIIRFLRTKKNILCTRGLSVKLVKADILMCLTTTGLT